MTRHKIDIVEIEESSWIGVAQFLGLALFQLLFDFTALGFLTSDMKILGASRSSVAQ